MAFQNSFFKDLSIIDFDCFVYSVGGVCDDAADRVVEAVGAGACQSRGKTAILSRCNFGVFSEAVRLTDANPCCRLHFIGVSVYPHINIWKRGVRWDVLRCGSNLIKLSMKTLLCLLSMYVTFGNHASVCDIDIFLQDIKNIGLDRIMDVWHLLQQTGQQLQEGEQRPHCKNKMIHSNGI